MIRAFHITFTAYGFWLPNDPRGSWSDFVRSFELLRYGKPTKVSTRRSLAAHPHDGPRRQAAKEVLQYPCVHFDGRQALSIANGFRQAIEEAEYVFHACAILPEHVHLVVARHPRHVNRIIGHLKARATQRLMADGLHPLAEYDRPDGSFPSPWARNGWVVYLNSHEQVHKAIDYTCENPNRDGKPRQRWSFVVPYGNWPVPARRIHPFSGLTLPAVAAPSSCPVALSCSARDAVSRAKWIAFRRAFTW